MLVLSLIGIVQVLLLVGLSYLGWRIYRLLSSPKLLVEKLNQDGEKTFLEIPLVKGKTKESEQKKRDEKLRIYNQALSSGTISGKNLDKLETESLTL